MLEGNWHVGRAWTGHALEDECPCPQEPCGLVAQDKIVDECPQHAVHAGKTLRQSHSPDNCPGPAAPKTRVQRGLRKVGPAPAPDPRDVTIHNLSSFIEVGGLAEIVRPSGRDSHPWFVMPSAASSDSPDEKARIAQLLREQAQCYDGGTFAREAYVLAADFIDALARVESATDSSGCRAPHCWHEYGTPCAKCPAASLDPPDDGVCGVILDYDGQFRERLECSLTPGHAGPHAAWTNHVVTDDPLSDRHAEWMMTAPAPSPDTPKLRAAMDGQTRPLPRDTPTTEDTNG